MEMTILLGQKILTLPVVKKNVWLTETNLIDKYKNSELIQDTKGNSYNIYETTNRQLVLVNE